MAAPKSKTFNLIKKYKLKKFYSLKIQKLNILHGKLFKNKNFFFKNTLNKKFLPITLEEDKTYKIYKTLL